VLKSLIDSLSKKALKLVIIFTVVETIVLTVWLLILFPSLLSLGVGTQIKAALVLLVGLFIEHILAAVSNKV
jgi:uncharacterized membrane protein